MNYELEIDEFEIQRKNISLHAGLLIDVRNPELGIYREIRIRHLRQNVINPSVYDLTVSDHRVIGGYLSTRYIVKFMVVDANSNPLENVVIRINFVDVITDGLGR